jgi:hypothetical protein
VLRDLIASVVGNADGDTLQGDPRLRDEATSTVCLILRQPPGERLVGVAALSLSLVEHMAELDLVSGEQCATVIDHLSAEDIDAIVRESGP